MLRWIKESDLNNLHFEVLEAKRGYSSTSKLKGIRNNSKQHKLPVLDKIHINGRLLFKKNNRLQWSKEHGSVRMNVSCTDFQWSNFILSFTSPLVKKWGCWGNSDVTSCMLSQSFSGWLNRLVYIARINVILTIVVSPEKLYERVNPFCMTISNRLAISVTHICILMAFALSL